MTHACWTQPAARRPLWALALALLGSACGADTCPPFTIEVDGYCRADAGVNTAAQSMAGSTSGKGGTNGNFIRAAPSGGAGDGAGELDPGCSPGVTRCAPDAKVEVCTPGGVWVVQQTCDSMCSMGACSGTCRPGKFRCGRDQTPESCTNAGEWQPEAPCPFVCSGDGQCSGECTPGQMRCGGPKALTPETCDPGGRWVPGSPCANVCMNGSCGGSCVPGTRICGNDNTPQLCTPAGSWEPGARCPFVCSGDGECSGECMPGQSRCDGNTPSVCDAQGRFQRGDACADSTCMRGSCQGVCTPGAARCSGSGTPQSCSMMGQWVDLDACEPENVGDDVSCRDGKCVSSCAVTRKSCGNSSKRYCVDFCGCTGEYTERRLTPDDDVCVRAEDLERIADQNRRIGTRDPSDDERCASGFVFRMATPDDRVCVEPWERDQAADQNARTCWNTNCPP